MARTPLKPAGLFVARRRGFTLIELMVAISIILILVAVAIAGISQVAKHAKANRTRTAMGTAKSLYAGYQANDSSLTALKALYSAADTTSLLGSTGPDLDTNTGCLVATKGVNGVHDWTQLSGNAALAKELDYTERAMQVLLRVPENKQLMDKLPAEAKYVLTSSNGVALPNVPPLLADGNGEPILFVPPAGLIGVSVNGVSGSGIEKSDGRLHPTSGVDPMPAANAQPFWVAAGSDRDYTTGDDNDYSFQHQ